MYTYTHILHTYHVSVCVCHIFSIAIPFDPLNMLLCDALPTPLAPGGLCCRDGGLFRHTWQKLKRNRWECSIFCHFHGDFVVI